MSDTTQFLLQALKTIEDGCRANGVKPGIIENISGTIFLIQKIRKYNEPKTIGFFGAQKRGKSSLINQLLGCDLMPVGPYPLSSVVIKVKHESNHAEGAFTIDIIDMDGHLDTNGNVDLASAQMLLMQYGSHRGGLSSGIDSITVTSNFNSSRILRDGGVLVDTPGAEDAFDPDKSSADNTHDTNRAISILSSMHVVIFVERADLMQSYNSQQFFSANLKSMRPLNVVNFKDNYYLDDKTSRSLPPELLEKTRQSRMTEVMLKTFGMNLDRILCVSSKEAATARKNKDKQLLMQSNVPALEERIVGELRNLDPKIGQRTCLVELEKNLAQIERETVRRIFRQAQRPFYVILNSENTPNNITELARRIYERYK